MKIVITDADTVTKGDIDLNVFGKYGEITVYGLTPPDAVRERVCDASVILCNKTPLNRNNLKDAASLAYIGLFSTGYNNIDLNYAAEKNIVVSNVPGYSAEAVAQHVFAFILSLYNRVNDYGDMINAGDWVKSRTFSFFPLPLYELSGKTLGIVGFGSIGRRVAEIARAFNMKILVHTRTPFPQKEVKIDIWDYVNFVSLEELFSNSDIVTLHCPLTPQTENLVNRETLAMMKKNGILINTSRGAVVDENALYEALAGGMISGAGLDVLVNEPMREDCVLRGAPNCIITPHIAWAGIETRLRLIAGVEANLRAFIAGEPANVVGIGK